jgi:ParB family chromosome partitioning protein
MSEEGRRRGLGRGLSALFGEEAEAPADTRPTRSLPIELLHPGKYQPRRRFDEDAMQALVESVRAQGILQPLLVRRHPDIPDAYEILAGERRWRAAQLAKLHEVPVLLREIGDRAALEIALVENVQRQDLSPLEEAQGYQRLIDEFGHTQEALAQAVGKSRSHIANTLRLLALPAEVSKLVEEGKLTAGHARALLSSRDPLGLAQEVVRRGLNVRQTETLVKDEHKAGGAARSPQHAPQQKDADILALERELSDHLGLKVEIAFDGTGGKLALHYSTLDQLDEVLKRLRRR